MILGEQAERWQKLKRLRWSIILLFFTLCVFNNYSSAKEIPFMSITQVAHAHFGTLFQILLIPALVAVGVKERRARLAVQASNRIDPGTEALGG